MKNKTNLNIQSIQDEIFPILRPIFSPEIIW